MRTETSEVPRTALRQMRGDDWARVAIQPGKYCNADALTGFQRRDGQGGNPLHPALGEDHLELDLAERLDALKGACSGAIAERCHVAMPYWKGPQLPGPDDYSFVDAPERLVSTSITIAMVPNGPQVGAGLTFSFDGPHLPTLRERMRGARFQGLLGNLGYFYTEALIKDYRWSHNRRYPSFPLDAMPSYIGFHLMEGEDPGELCGSFDGAHPGAVAVDSRRCLHLSLIHI